MLKVSNLKKDYKEAKAIMKKFSSSKYLSIITTLNQNEEFTQNINELQLTHLDLTNNISKLLPLENKLEVNHSNISNIKELSIKQKELIYHLGKELTATCKHIIKKIS